jgi:hypothetical protein
MMAGTAAGGLVGLDLRVSAVTDLHVSTRLTLRLPLEFKFRWRSFFF